MNWSAEDIEKRFLSGKLSALAPSPETVLSAFARVERLLGLTWIESETASAKGLAPTMGVIGMGLRLAALEGIPDADKLLTRILDGDRSAEAELTAIYLVRTHASSAKLELHPNVGHRKADFRLRNENEPWTIVEVTYPNTSKEAERLTKILERVTDALKDAKHQFTLEVIFNREPSDRELKALCEHLPEFCELQGAQQAHLVDGLGFLFLNQIPMGHLLKREIRGVTDRPMLGLAMFAGGGPGGGPHHQVFVRLPFTDERAAKVLWEESTQLSKDEPGLVMIDVASASGAFESWSALIQRRLQPTIHTRISGVCLFEGGMMPTDKGYDWLLRTKLLTNPNARFQLPGWIQDTIALAGEAAVHLKL